MMETYEGVNVIPPSGPEPKPGSRFITIYKPIAGWKAVEYWWNPAMGGFWEPWMTSDLAFGTAKEAAKDALSWAQCADRPITKDVVEALK